MFVRDGRDGEVIEHPLLSPDERTIRLNDDTVPVTIIYDLPLLAERMKLTQAKKFEMSRGRVTCKYNQWFYLDLVHGWGLEPRLSDLFEVVNATT
jgi:hypothetical protein